jgi:glycerol-3-phosphate dehydrogenase
LIGGTKGSHIIVGRFDGAPKDAFYVEAAADGRPFFIIPWNRQYLIGTTDIRYEEDLDHIRASAPEVEYLLNETNRVFPKAALTRDDIHFAYAGVRPLPFKEGGPESAITRRHIIKVNKNIARGLISIVGGKLTTYRSLAEQTVDKLARLQRLKLPACRTRDSALPGAWGLERAREALDALGTLSEEGVDRLLSIYGGRAAALAELCSKNPELSHVLDGHCFSTHDDWLRCGPGAAHVRRDHSACGCRSRLEPGTNHAATKRPQWIRRFAASGVDE